MLMKCEEQIHELHFMLEWIWHGGRETVGRFMMGTRRSTDQNVETLWRAPVGRIFFGQVSCVYGTSSFFVTFALAGLLSESEIIWQTLDQCVDIFIGKHILRFIGHVWLRAKQQSSPLAEFTYYELMEPVILRL